MRCLIAILCFLTSLSISAQNIVGFEYFYDHDPGVGNGEFVASTSTIDSLTQELTLSGTDTLSPGFHFVGVRTLDDLGVWSHYTFRSFKVDDGTIASSVDTTYQPIIGLEYFYDQDPGIGNGEYVAFTSPVDSLSGEYSFTGTDTLEKGFHFVGIRTLDQSGKWGHYIFRSFNIKDTSSVIIDTTTYDVVGYEYFVDNDPGIGNAIYVSLPASLDSTTTEITIPTSVTDTLTAGFHFIGIRTVDEAGLWSHYTFRSFSVVREDGTIGIDTVNSPLVGYEYFYDNDPGVGKGVFITLDEPVDSLTSEFILSGTDTLSPGFHFVGIRALDSLGKWGHYIRRSFRISGDDVLNLDTNSYPIIGYEYFFDDVDPGVGNGTYNPFASPALSLTEELSISSDTLSLGEHKITFRLLDSIGQWSHNYTNVFDICLNPPAKPTFAIGGTVCNGSGDVTYRAEGSPTGEYNWYTSSSGGEPIEATVFPRDEIINDTLIRSISESEELFVATKDNGCNSSRLKVEGIVVPELSKPQGTNRTRCGDGTITFIPSSGAPLGGTYRWFESDTANIPLFIGDEFETPFLSENVSYFVESVNGNLVCKSDERLGVVAIIKTCISQEIVVPEISDVIFGIDEPTPLKAFTVDPDGNSTNQKVIYRIVEGQDRAFIRNDTVFYTGIGVVKVVIGALTDTTYTYSDPITVQEEFRIVADAAEVEITDNSPVCENQRLILNPTPIKDGIYRWITPSGGIVDSRVLSIFPVTKLDTGTYKLFVATPVDTLSSSVDVEVNPAPEQVFLDSIKVSDCANKSFLLKGIGTGFELYQWYFDGGLLTTTDTSSFTPFETGTYSLVALDSNDCSSGTPPLYINLNPDSIPVITWDEARSKLIASPGVTYQWYINNLLIANGTAQELALYVNGSYKVEVTGIDGCTFFSDEFEISEDEFFDLSKWTENNEHGVSKEHLEVTPQPATGKLNLNLFSFQEEGKNLYELYNAQGQVVASGMLHKITKTSYQKTVDISSLNPGLYYLRMPRINFIKTQKVIIE